MNAITRVDAPRLPAAARPTTEAIDPHALDAAEREALTAALYASHCRIFDGVDRAGFTRYVVESPAAWTRIFVLRDGDGTVRGYTAFHLFEVTHEGRPVAIARMEAGFEPQHRGDTRCGRFAMQCFARAYLRAGRRPLYFLCSPIHPSSFVTISRNAPAVLTVPTAAPAERRFITALARTLGMAPVDGRPGVYHVGWITRPGPAPRRISAEAAFYFEANPGYTEGHGLLTVVPVSIGGMARAALRLATRRLRRVMGR